MGSDSEEKKSTIHPVSHNPPCSAFLFCNFMSCAAPMSYVLVTSRVASINHTVTISHVNSSRSKAEIHPNLHLPAKAEAQNAQLNATGEALASVARHAFQQDDNSKATRSAVLAISGRSLPQVGRQLAIDSHNTPRTHTHRKSTLRSVIKTIQ